jgi:hypothetical protein
MEERFPKSMIEADYSIRNDRLLVLETNQGVFIGRWFDTEDLQKATQYAETRGLEIFTFCNSHLGDWLERRIGLANRFLYVVLPKGLPDFIALHNDDNDDGEYIEVDESLWS